MANDGGIAPELLRAYRDTLYRATTPVGELTLRIGESSKSLDALLRRCEAQNWAYLTAYNPGSVQRDRDENERTQEQLLDALEAEATVVFPGVALSADDGWPPEPSFLALGVEASQGAELGLAFGQNAIVIGELGAPAKLLTLV